MQFTVYQILRLKIKSKYIVEKILLLAIVEDPKYITDDTYRKQFLEECELQTQICCFDEVYNNKMTYCDRKKQKRINHYYTKTLKGPMRINDLIGLTRRYENDQRFILAYVWHEMNDINNKVNYIYETKYMNRSRQYGVTSVELIIKQWKKRYPVVKYDLLNQRDDLF